MDMSSAAQRKLVAPCQRTRVEELLRSYPAVTKDEVGEILHFLNDGPAPEVALLNANESLRPRLFQFRHDYMSPPLGFRNYVIAAVIIVALVAICALLWDAGAGS